MGSILDRETPDLVVLTGDIVHSPERSLDACRKVAAPMIESGIPWAPILGNHDDEGDAVGQKNETPRHGDTRPGPSKTFFHRLAPKLDSLCVR